MVLPQADPHSLIDLDAVRFAYPGGEEVLRGVSLRVEAGRCHGLIGPNGAGKSTILRLAAGLLQPGSGSIAFGGCPLTGMTGIEIARQIGWVPQEIDTAFPFTAGEIVLMGRYPHVGAFGLETDHDRAVAARCLADHGLDRLAGRPFTTLSGGEKRRVLIASALAQEPRVLLLDEPTAGLDLTAQGALARTLDRLARKGLGILLVSHDLNLAARLCDRVALLDAGTIVAEGRPTEVFTANRLSALFGSRVLVMPHGADGLPVALPDFDRAAGKTDS
jgi:iron complex transport system ATP-binding protein